MSYKKNLADDNRNYQIGITASKGLELYHDTQVLCEKLIDYLEENVKDYEFTDFFDKQFVDNFKALIKNEDKFNGFLNEISFTIDEFLHTAVYICPHCFTSNIIKFIKLHYLGKIK